MRLKQSPSWLRESTDSSGYEHVALSLAQVHLKLCQLVKTNNQLCETVFKSLCWSHNVIAIIALFCFLCVCHFIPALFFLYCIVR